MKFSEYIKEEKEVNLIGTKIDGRKVTVETPYYYWKGMFDCRGVGLTSLKGAPYKVGGDFNCASNKLTSLEGCPSEVGGGFYCTNNKLTSLVGAPKDINGSFNCSINQLTNLKDIHKMITRITGMFLCGNNQIKSHVLGLLLIDGLRKIHGDSFGDDHWCGILNKYLDKGRAGLLDAQAELIEAGLEEYAQL